MTTATMPGSGLIREMPALIFKARMPVRPTTGTTTTMTRSALAQSSGAS